VRNEVAAIPEPEKLNGFWVRLRPVTVPDKVILLAESGLGADDAGQHVDDPARLLFRRGHEEALPSPSGIWKQYSIFSPSSSAGVLTRPRCPATFPVMSRDTHSLLPSIQGS
jgi:hypothetical protein